MFQLYLWDEGELWQDLIARACTSGVWTMRRRSGIRCYHAGVRGRMMQDSRLCSSLVLASDANAADSRVLQIMPGSK